jgi:alpha-tubulin suppressor-like RCC1 family protein
VVRPDTSLWCWGGNRYGQLGNGGTGDAAQPVRVTAPADHWLTVAVGAESTCALRSDAGLWCWGDNRYGQLGDGSATARRRPVRVGGSQTWVALAVGTHTCAVRTDHTLWCWGAGAHGELGDGTTQGRRAPGQVGAETTWAAVSVQEARTCAVRQNGSSECWGATA